MSNFVNKEDAILTVISTSGVNLRSHPDQNANILEKVNYGEQLLKIGGTGERENIMGINGQWVKVKYKKLEGYVFDPYVITSNWDFPTLPLNEKFALLCPVCTCFGNFQYNAKLKWYGIFKTPSGFEAKQVFYSYHRQAAAIGEEVCIDVTDDKKPLFILGSQMNIKATSGAYAKPVGLPGAFNNTELINRNFFYDHKLNKLIYCYENREIDVSEKELIPNTLSWRGDLNEDGVEDFIVDFGDKFSKSILYLSFKVNKQVTFKKTAEFYNGYCC